MIKKVYVYLILFTTLMMVIGGSVAVFMAAADILTPTLIIKHLKIINCALKRG